MNLENGIDAGLPAEIRMPEIISALSFALDLTEGAVPGHAVRSTVLGMRIGMELKLPDSVLGSLYYALQMKDIGCSNNASRMAQLFGNHEQHAKAVMKLTDWTGLLRGDTGSTFQTRMHDLVAGVRSVPGNGRMLWSAVLPGANPVSKLKRILDLGKHAEANTQELISLRCDRGASILRKLDLDRMACDSVRHLDERWDGSGYPEGLAGEAIPLMARISAIAQHLDVFATAVGMDESIRTLRRRSGTWFDPSLVRLASALHKQGSLWIGCEPGCSVAETRATAVSMSIETPKALGTDQIDSICEAFAEVVDAKSPFTYRHSVGVTATTVALAEALELPPHRKVLLKRAALLHDLGKLGVPNAILDKPGKLTEGEREVIFRHPGMSRTILNRVTGFQDLAQITGEHHEKLDGSGYPDRLSANQLSLESRLLTVADCFTALVEERPYRAAIPLPTVVAILKQETPNKLDASIVCVLESLVDQWQWALPPSFDRGRQDEVCDFGVRNGERFAASAS